MIERHAKPGGRHDGPLKWDHDSIHSGNYVNICTDRPRQKPRRRWNKPRALVRTSHSYHLRIGVVFCPTRTGPGGTLDCARIWPHSARKSLPWSVGERPQMCAEAPLNAITAIAKATMRRVVLLNAPARAPFTTKLSRSVVTKHGHGCDVRPIP
jgi:hypothetical protein